MDNGFDMVYVLLGVTAAIALLVLWRYLSINVLNPAGNGAAAKTRATLRRFAGIRRFQVLSDVTVEKKGKTARIENLMIGFFGVLMVHTLGARGEYYGTLDGDQWYVVLDQKRTAFPNPVTEQEKAEAVLRSIFADNKLYSIPIEHIVYISSKSKKTGLFITNSGEILTPGKLWDYLNKTKFEKDIGLDVEKVAKAIEGAGVK
jgi:uncharacterized protein YhhL (DUF1145 family)